MESIVENKSFEFAVRIVNLYKHLTAEKKEYTISKQLLKAEQALVLMYAKASKDSQRLIFMLK